MSSELRTARSVQITTLTLVILATLATELAIAAPDASPRTVLIAAVGYLIAPMLALAFWLGQRGGDSTERSRLVRTVELGAILLLLVLPLGQRAVLSAWTGRGMPLEVGLLAGLRNLGLGLAAFASRATWARLAALVSLFLILVASALNDSVVVLGAVGIYAVAGVVWLMLADWARLAPALAGQAQHRLPTGAVLVWGGVIAAVMVGAVAVGPSRAATVLAEWVASSGGTGASDPDARSGVNDGDNEVAASKDPKSIGFTASELYLESDRPSLYDSFSDMYGEPPKPKTKQERMVAMAPQKNQAMEHPTENLHAGRSFPTVRQQPNRPTGQGAERAAKALIYVKGATPAHLGLATYAHFDGVTWDEEALCNHHCPLELIPGAGAWLKVDQITGGPFAGSHHHQIKIGTLDSRTLPVPAHVTRFRVGSVNRPEFFGWAQAGLLAMVERTVPAGTVIDTESQTTDPRRLRALAFGPPTPTPGLPYLDLPATLDPGVKRLVQSWTAGTERGWAEVEAIVAGVRRHCIHDRQQTPPADLTDVVGWFLMQSRCGPDHHFATATAVALRLLGYPSRVVSGYYAAPDRFDPRTHHTPVTAEDVHFWVEVLVPGGTWAAVEPTPGYELMAPALSILDQVAATVQAIWGWTRTHAGPLGIGLAGLIGAVVARRRWLDLAATALWWLIPVSSPRARALRTLRLVEQRSSRAGLRRPAGRTPTRWYHPIAAQAPGDPRAELERLLAIAGWASHAPPQPDHASPWSAIDVDLACRQAVQTWTLRRFLACRPST